MNLKIEYWPLDKIIPYERNAKLHNIDWIKRSIEEFKPDQPIVVDGDGVIIKGHGRLEAAKALDLKTFPVIVRTDLSEAESRLSRIADNRSSEAGWDFEKLNAEIHDIKIDLPDFDLEEFGIDEGLMKDSFEVSETQPPELKDGDRSPFQQMTFTLHDDQAEQVKAAISKAKNDGPFIDTQNENSNGNALARLAEFYCGKS